MLAAGAVVDDASARPEAADGPAPDPGLDASSLGVFGGAGSDASVTFDSRSADAIIGSDGAPMRPRDADLVVALRLDGETVADAMPAVRVGARLYAPFDMIAGALAFPIAWSSAQARASGWFIAETRRFELDLATRRVERDGRAFPMGEGDVLVRDGDLFVAIDALAVWLPVDIAFDRPALAIEMRSRERLPVQARRARAAARAALMGRHVTPSADAAPTPTAAVYDDLGVEPVWPSGVASTRITWVKGRGLVRIATAQAVGDVFGATASGFVAHTNAGPSTPSRVRVFRESPEGRALGPTLSRWLPATRWDVGDVVSVDMPLGWRSVTGRGLSLTNAPTTPTVAFDRLTVEGDAPDGYDVELYRNGLLIDARGDVRDGRYRFLDAPLELGANDLEVVLWGPQGQEIRRRETIVIGPDALRAGEVRYAVSALTDARSGAGVRPAGDSGGWRGGARVEAGLTRTTTLVARVAASPMTDGPSALVGGGLRQRLGPVYVRGDVVGSSRQAEAASLGAIARWRGVSFDVASTSFAPEAHSDPRRAEAGLVRGFDASATFGVGGGEQRTPVSFAMRRRETVFGRVESGLSARTSMRAGATAFNAVFDVAALRDPLGAETSTATAAIDANRRIAGVGFRLTTETDIAHAALRRAGATVDVATRAGPVRLGLDTSFRPRLTTASLSYAWRIAGGELSLDASSDPAGRTTTIGLGLRVALAGPAYGRGPVFADAEPEHTGQIFARVFEDRDADGVFSPGDRPMPGVKVTAPGAGADAMTDHDGVVRFTGAPTGARTIVSLDLASLPDPYLAPLRPGFAVRARAGGAAMAEFPVVQTSDIEGKVVLAREGRSDPLDGADIVVQRLDGGPVQVLRTAFDGVYFLGGAVKGRYRITLSDRTAARLGIRPKSVEFDVPAPSAAAPGGTIAPPPLILEAPPRPRADLDARPLAVGIGW